MKIKFTNDSGWRGFSDYTSHTGHNSFNPHCFLIFSFSFFSTFISSFLPSHPFSSNISSFILLFFTSFLIPLFLLLSSVLVVQDRRRAQTGERCKFGWKPLELLFKAAEF